MLKQSVPVFDQYDNSPKLLTFFMFVICAITISLLVSTATTFLYYVPVTEADNFRTCHAVVSIMLAKVLSHQ